MSDPADFEAAFKSAVDRAAREFAGEAEGTVSDHPGLDELVDFQEGRLTGDDAEYVRRHLEACPECAREVRELEAFDVDEPPASNLRPSPEETAADWKRFQDRVARETTGGKVLEMPSPRAAAEHLTPTGEPPRSWSLRWLTMAASLMIGVIGVGLWIASQRVEPPPAPRNPYAFDLVPDGEDLVRDAAMLARVEVPAGMDTLVPRLNLGDQTPYDAYRAEIANQAGVVVWSQSDLVRQPTGQFVVLLDAVDLTAGTYRLSLFGALNGGETKLATYTFELSRAPEP